MLSNNIGYNRIYARINMDNIRHNIRCMKEQTKSGTKILVVIKADAYGHGAAYIANHITDLADCYGVATIDEAIEIRNSGVTAPILIIGYTDERDYDKLIAYNITQTVYDVEKAKRLSELAIKNNCKVSVHIKVDTGMSRIGFMADDEGIEEAKKIFALPGLSVEGIFSHYAKADEHDKDFTKEQKRRLLYFIDALENAGFNVGTKHIDNSAGTMEMNDDEFDMVRLGIVTYGLYPSDEVDKSIEIKPAMSVVAHVAHVKTLPEGVGVSYGSTYVTDKPTRIATVTAGYADGYPRGMSGVGRVIIRDEYAPIVGRVCMDQLMVDVSHIEGVSVSDEVTIIGRCGDKNIPIEELAEPSASFNYELVCNISRRVPRVYSEEGKDVAVYNDLL